MQDIFEIEKTISTGLSSKHLIAIIRGEGALVWDSDGREYIDCVSGHGVAALGHAHPEIVHAIAEQAAALITCPETYYNPLRNNLADKLVSLAPEMERVFFCNSGAEAVEAALKFARYSTERTQVVAAMRGFHGRTFGALSATWKKAYRQPFEPLVPGFSHIPFNNVDALEKAVDEKTAAVLLEPVQGEGGVHVADVEFLRAAERICREKGALFIADEVQTGLGRTGKMLAVEHSDVHPDLICLAKAIGGGVPMGVVLLGPRVKDLSPGLHYSTFGGNPLACAASLATLNVMERESLPQQAAEKGVYLKARLSNINVPTVREVRGLGLMVGIELKHKVTPVLEGLLSRGIIALPCGLNILRLLPPLVISYDQIDRVVEAIDDVLAEVGRT